MGQCFGSSFYWKLGYNTKRSTDMAFLGADTNILAIHRAILIANIFPFFYLVFHNPEVILDYHNPEVIGSDNSW